MLAGRSPWVAAGMSSRMASVRIVAGMRTLIAERQRRCSAVPRYLPMVGEWLGVAIITREIRVRTRRILM